MKRFLCCYWTCVPIYVEICSEPWIRKQGISKKDGEYFKPARSGTCTKVARDAWSTRRIFASYVYAKRDQRPLPDKRYATFFLCRVQISGIQIELWASAACFWVYKRFYGTDKSNLFEKYTRVKIAWIHKRGRGARRIGGQVCAALVVSWYGALLDSHGGGLPWRPRARVSIGRHFVWNGRVITIKLDECPIRIAIIPAVFSPCRLDPFLMTSRHYLYKVRRRGPQLLLTSRVDHTSKYAQRLRSRCLT